MPQIHRKLTPVLDKPWTIDEVRGKPTSELIISLIQISSVPTAGTMSDIKETFENIAAELDARIPPRT